MHVSSLCRDPRWRKRRCIPPDRNFDTAKMMAPSLDLASTRFLGVAAKQSPSHNVEVFCQREAWVGAHDSTTRVHRRSSLVWRAQSVTLAWERPPPTSAVLRRRLAQRAVRQHRRRAVPFAAGTWQVELLGPVRRQATGTVHRDPALRELHVGCKRKARVG